MNKWTYCPRCGHGTFENLGSYSHCVECLHFSDSYEDYETTLIRAMRGSDIKTTTQNALTDPMLKRRKEPSENKAS